jgi:hypothetical protein
VFQPFNTRDPENDISNGLCNCVFLNISILIVLVFIPPLLLGGGQDSAMSLHRPHSASPPSETLTNGGGSRGCHSRWRRHGKRGTTSAHHDLIEARCHEHQRILRSLSSTLRNSIPAVARGAADGAAASSRLVAPRGAADGGRGGSRSWWLVAAASSWLVAVTSSWL